MYDFAQSNEITSQAKRLLGFRIPLVLVILVNAVLLARVPAPSAAPPTAAVQPTAERDGNQHDPLHFQPSALSIQSSLSVMESVESCCNGIGSAIVTAKNSFTVLPAWKQQQAAVPGQTHDDTTWGQRSHLAPTPDDDRVGQTEDEDSNATPSESIQPRHTEELVIVNPAENHGTVCLLVNAQLCQLPPGESRRFRSGQVWHIQYHRGEDYGEVDRTVSSGHYQFTITSTGWELTRLEADNK